MTAEEDKSLLEQAIDAVHAAGSTVSSETMKTFFDVAYPFIAGQALIDAAAVLDRVANNFEDFGLPEGLDDTRVRLIQMRIDAQFLRDTAAAGGKFDHKLYDWTIHE